LISVHLYYASLFYISLTLTIKARTIKIKMNKPLYLFSFIAVTLLSFFVIALLASNTGEKEKYFTDTGALYIGEAGCNSMKNFGSLESTSSKLNVLFPEITFSHPSRNGVLKFRSRFSSKNEDVVKKTVTEQVLPYLHKRYEFFKSVESCIVFPTKPYLIKFERLAVSGEKYKILSYTLVLFFILIFILFLSAPRLKKILKKHDEK